MLQNVAVLPDVFRAWPIPCREVSCGWMDAIVGWMHLLDGSKSRADQREDCVRYMKLLYSSFHIISFHQIKSIIEQASYYYDIVCTV